MKLKEYAMFRRGRGRPLLATAVVVGASRSAARHEVAKQGQINAEAQRAADFQAQEALRQEARNDERMQAAIAAALEKDRRENARTPIPKESGPVHQSQSYETTGDIKRYCSACGDLRMPGAKFWSHCGFLHQKADNNVSPPHYRESPVLG